MPSREDPNPPEPVGIKEPTPPEAEIALQTKLTKNDLTENDQADSTDPTSNSGPDTHPVETTENSANSPDDVPAAKEYGGPAGLEPTRYGDWEKNGRCSDF